MYIRNWRLHFVPFVVMMAFSTAYADQVSDAASKLDAMLPTVQVSITDSNQATQAVVLLRAIAVMNVTMSRSQMAVAAPVVFHATLVYSSPDNNQVPKEAKITMAALGYGIENLTAFVDYIVNTKDIRLRQAMLIAINEQTKSARSNLRNIGIAKLADLYAQQVAACQHDASGPTSSRAVYAPSGSPGAPPDSFLADLISLPEVSDLTDSERFASLLAAESIECFGGGTNGTREAYRLLHGVDRKRLLMDKLTTDLATLKSIVGGGGGWSIRVFLLNELHIDFMTSLLIGDGSYAGSSSNVTWDEVATFPAADKNYLTDAMIRNIGDELDINMTSVVIWGGRLKVFENGAIGANTNRLFSFIPMLGTSGKSLLPHMEPFLTVSGENIPLYKSTIDRVKAF